MCTDRRQEWILLSDTLGVSMLLETTNHRARDGRTAEFGFALAEAAAG